jgi:hypothetical protein
VVILDRPNLKLDWLETERVLRKTCSGHVTGPVLRELYALATSTLSERGGSRILSDNRGLLPTPAEDLLWVEQEALPRLVTAGWRSWAVLPPENPLGAMSLRRWQSLYRNHAVTVAVFVREQEALAWLACEPDGGPRQT